jgi:hypothetical protein
MQPPFRAPGTARRAQATPPDGPQTQVNRPAPGTGRVISLRIRPRRYRRVTTRHARRLPRLHRHQITSKEMQALCGASVNNEYWEAAIHHGRRPGPRCGGSRSGSGPRLPQHGVDVDRWAGEQLIPAALLEQTLLPLPAHAAALLQPCRPPPLLDHLAEGSDVAGLGGLPGGGPQRRLVGVALVGGEVVACVVDPLSDGRLVAGTTPSSTGPSSRSSGPPIDSGRYPNRGIRRRNEGKGRDG